MLLPCSCHAIPMELLCNCHAIAMQLPCDCHAVAMILPSDCHTIAMQLPCNCHVIAMILPCYCHAIAMLSSSSSLQKAFGLSLRYESWICLRNDTRCHALKASPASRELHHICDVPPNGDRVRSLGKVPLDMANSVCTPYLRLGSRVHQPDSH